MQAVNVGVEQGGGPGVSHFICPGLSYKVSAVSSTDPDGACIAEFLSITDSTCTIRIQFEYIGTCLFEVSL